MAAVLRLCPEAAVPPMTSYAALLRGIKTAGWTQALSEARAVV